MEPAKRLLTPKTEVLLLLQVLEDSRQILVAANMHPNDPFPMDDKVKEGLAPFHLSLLLSGLPSLL